MSKIMTGADLGPGYTLTDPLPCARWSSAAPLRLSICYRTVDTNPGLPRHLLAHHARLPEGARRCDQRLTEPYTPAGCGPCLLTPATMALSSPALACCRPHETSQYTPSYQYRRLGADGRWQVRRRSSRRRTHILCSYILRHLYCRLHDAHKTVDNWTARSKLYMDRTDYTGLPLLDTIPAVHRR